VFAFGITPATLIGLILPPSRNMAGQPAKRWRATTAQSRGPDGLGNVAHQLSAIAVRSGMNPLDSAESRVEGVDQLGGEDAAVGATAFWEPEGMAIVKDGVIKVG
jgi:hypothetical protein